MGEVIDIFSAKKKKEEKKGKEEKKEKEAINMEALEKSYNGFQARMKEERNKVNKSVIRSYRLKK